MGIFVVVVVYTTYIYFWYISFIYVGQAASKQFSGQAAALRLLGPILCVFCAFVSCTCGPLRGGGRGTSAVHYASCIFYVCVCMCAKREEGKAALAAAICSPVTKIFCPKTLSSVNIYGAIAVQAPSPPPLPLSLCCFSLC